MDLCDWEMVISHFGDDRFVDLGVWERSERVWLMMGIDGEKFSSYVFAHLIVLN